MQLTINGESRSFEEQLNIPQLLQRLDLPEKAVLIEHNGTALFRTEWEKVTLHSGDTLEIIKIVAGG